MFSSAFVCLFVCLLAGLCAKTDHPLLTKIVWKSVRPSGTTYRGIYMTIGPHHRMFQAAFVEHEECCGISVLGEQMCTIESDCMSLNILRYWNFLV